MTTTDARHPYETLTPDVVLDALASVGLYGDGRLLGLSSYENRVYQVHLEEPFAGAGIVVAKFYRPGRWSDAHILEEHAFAAQLQEAEVPAVGPLAPAGGTLHHHAGFAFSISPRRGGRAPELDDEEVLEWIGRYLARLHTVGSREPFTLRPAIDLQGFGEEPRDWLLAHDAIPLDVQGEWQRACELALTQIRTAFVASREAGVRQLRLHGDCHPGNILWSDAGPCFVDLDDAMNGPAVQDLWMLFGADTAGAALAREAVLEGYERFRPFDRRELALVEPLRTLRMVHHSAWIARRWHDPAFPAAFPFFTAADYWRQQAMQLREQVEAMQAA
jgi:Ser/Thr protein kinase RdoA (MazF antagonist)